MKGLKELVGIDLGGWRIHVWYQLSLPTGETGARVAGYFTDKDLATAQGKGKGWYGHDGTVQEVHVLTEDGTNGYLVREDQAVSISDEATLRQETLEGARTKLTPAERAMLKL